MHLFVLYGPPAVGKLTIGKILSENLQIPLVDNHSITNPLARVFGWGHPEQYRLGEKFRFELFESAAREDKSLITTLGGGGAYYDFFVQTTKRIVESHGGSVVFVRLTSPEDVLFDRVSNQSRVDKFTISEREKLADVFSNNPDVFASVLVPNLIEIDTSKQSPAVSAEMIVQAFKEWGE